MSVSPVGYEAFQSKRRKAVTLLCFVLAAAMIMGISVYVDSYSIHEWENQTDVGEGALVITGSYREGNVEDILDVVAEFPEIEKISTITTGEGTLIVEEGYSTWHQDGQVVALADDFLETFPEYFTIEGHYPTNENEIMIHSSAVEYLPVGIGDTIEYSPDWGSTSVTVEIVGVFDKTYGQSEETYYYYYGMMAIVTEENMNRRDSEMEIIADVDRTPITPFNAQNSLAYLIAIHEKIHSLDPQYENNYYSRYRVNDRLFYGIYTYLQWQSAMRIGQIMRAGGIVLLVVLVAMISIRYNMKDRKYERSMLQARGATRSQLDKSVTREVLLVALFATVLGLALGILGSRVAMATEGFFTINVIKLFSEPLLVTLDSLLLALILGMVLPFASLIVYRNVVTTQEKATGSGRISTLARGLRIVKWDFLVMILAMLMLYGLLSAGPIIQFIPFLSLFVNLLPLAVFIGMASLTVKALKRGAMRVSKGFNRIIGLIPSSIGVRRIGREASSAGVVAAVIVLAISLAWSNAVLDVSLPDTELRHSRFALGADVTIELDNSRRDLWDSLQENITTDSRIKGTSIVSQVPLMVSQYTPVPFMAIEPEYLQIGYDYLGDNYDNSTLSHMFNELTASPDYAIVTEDVAQSYELTVGSKLPAYIELGPTEIVLQFRIIGIVDGLTDFSLLPDPYGNGYWGIRTVGIWRILVNLDYVSSFLNISQVSDRNFLCASTVENANGTEIMNDLISEGALGAIQSNKYSSTTTLVDRYINAVTYQMDRAIDTMMLVTLVGTIFGAFTIYATESIRHRKREIALLRSVGATNRTIIGIQITEMLTLTLISILLLLLFSPLYIVNSLVTSRWSYSYSIKLYPVDVMLVIPFVTMIGVLIFFTLLTTLFIVVAAFIGSKINLAESLNASWADAGPVGGDV